MQSSSLDLLLSQWKLFDPVEFASLRSNHSCWRNTSMDWQLQDMILIMKDLGMAFEWSLMVS